MKLLITMVALLTSPLSWSTEGIGSPVRKSSPGVYWVPVGQQLAQFALFNLPNVSVEISDDKVKVEYELPQELTGAINKITMEGPNGATGPIVLKGSQGFMSCASDDDLSNCAVSYYTLNFDPQTRSALLESISRGEIELRQRQMVAARFQFGGEPHGFLRVLPKSGTSSY